ncbi:MAG: outer membrane beta-barrel protein [Bacteroidota bacterium]
MNYRVLLLFIGICCVAACELSAQSIRFGTKQGVVRSSFLQVEGDDFSANTGFELSVLVNKRFKNSPLALQIETGCRQLGAHTDISTRFGIDRVTRKRNLEFEHWFVAVMPRVDLLPDSRINPSLMMGPVADFRLESRLTDTQLAGNFTDMQGNPVFVENFFGGSDLNGSTEPVMLGFLLAGGVEWNTEPVILSLEVRYYSAITNMFTNSIDSQTLEDAKHQYFGLMLGFNFYID